MFIATACTNMTEPSEMRGISLGSVPSKGGSLYKYFVPCIYGTHIYSPIPACARLLVVAPIFCDESLACVNSSR